LKNKKNNMQLTNNATLAFCYHAKTLRTKKREGSKAVDFRF